jgi:hypothetical protein
MNHSANIYKEIANSEQNDNSDHPNIAEKIVDIKSNQSGHGPPKSGPNSDEAKNSCSVDVIGNLGVASKHSDVNNVKSATGIKRNGLSMSKTDNKENHSLNHSMMDDHEMPASATPIFDSKTPLNEAFRDKIIDKILKKLRINLIKYKNDHVGSVEDIGETLRTFEIHIRGRPDEGLIEMLEEHGERLEDIDNQPDFEQHSNQNSDADDTEDLKMDVKSHMSNNEIKQEEIVMMTNLSTSVNSIIESEMSTSKSK